MRRYLMTSRLGNTKVVVLFGLCATFAVMIPCSARADVKLPHMFTDHAVLQRGMPVPVWGKADPGEAVEVKIAGQTKKT
jgi:sialate O-acetylesterase